MDNNEKFVSVCGGRTSQVLKERDIKEELTNKEDVLVIVSGTNDIARNEGGDALARIKETLDKFSDKHIILVDLPNRYNLVDWSCVNLATKKISEELKGLNETYNNVTMVEARKICEAAGIGPFQLEHVPSSTSRHNYQFGKWQVDTRRPPTIGAAAFNNKVLSIFHLNLQSIRNKLFSLDLMLDKLSCNVLCINEHWLCQDETLRSGWVHFSCYLLWKTTTHQRWLLYVCEKWIRL
ncbi:hypothetical protein J6590_101673 [Homalodisca vitripennis]|nr:hypothetical protein J6590_101673 [Homalodisca vitripennis]